MKKLFPILPFLALLLTACTGDPAVDAVHNTADSLMAVNRPDSALQLIHSLDSSLRFPSFGGTEGRLSHRQRMRHELLRAKAMNKAYVDFTTDSVMRLVADYYDRHGTPNERMEAHYLLGCTYRDMGEAPRAIDCYLDAAACADTTAADCDFYTLASIHAQTAHLYHQQLLLSYEIEEHRNASHYNYLAKDTLHAISEYRKLAGTYILLNKKDSAEAITKAAIALFVKHGFIQEYIQASLSLMYLYSEHENRLPELKRLIDNYDSVSNYFDKHHELHSTRRQFYYYKGMYFEGKNQLDSAEFYFRKNQYPDMPYTARNSMYYGLFRVFKKLRNQDSITKYAELYCEANDSSIAIKDQELTAQLAASYQYNRIQKESNRNAEKARQANMRLFIVSVSLLAIAVFTAILVFRYRRQKRRQQAAFLTTVAERARLQEELNSLKARNYDAVIARKEEEIEKLNKTIAEHEMAYRNVMSNDRLSTFVESSIVRRFTEKSKFRKDSSDITNDEWDELVEEFRQDMPSACSLMKGLSVLQLQVCILLLLNYDETIIAILKNTKPQTINNAKLRANKKLFQSGDAASLKTNLKRLISA